MVALRGDPPKGDDKRLNNLVAVTVVMLTVFGAIALTLGAALVFAANFAVSGTVTAVNVQEGDTVTAGQVLAVVDTLSLNADLLSAKPDRSGMHRDQTGDGVEPDVRDLVAVVIVDHRMDAGDRRPGAGAELTAGLVGGEAAAEQVERRLGGVSPSLAIKSSHCRVAAASLARQADRASNSRAVWRKVASGVVAGIAQRVLVIVAHHDEGAREDIIELARGLEALVGQDEVGGVLEDLGEEQDRHAASGARRRRATAPAAPGAAASAGAAGPPAKAAIADAAARVKDEWLSS